MSVIIIITPPPPPGSGGRAASRNSDAQNEANGNTALDHIEQAVAAGATIRIVDTDAE